MAGNDFDVIGKITVDDQGRVAIQGLSNDIDGVATHTSSLGSVSDFVWGGIIVKGIEMAVQAIGKAITAIGDFFASTIQSAKESQDALANLNATIASTGGVAGVSSEQAQALASSLESVTKFSDETIINGEAMLLTFTQIGSDIFPQATEAMLNLAQKFGSVDAASVQLGKALNDPITGVTALRRVGVMLTDQQEEAIKKFMEEGDIMSAQKIILGELQTEFGGLAQAMGQTASGQAAIAMNQLDNFKELIGGPLLAAVTAFRLSWMSTFMNSDFVQGLVAFLKPLNDFISQGLPLIDALGYTLMNMQGVPRFFYDIGVALVNLQTLFDSGHMTTLQAFQVWALDLADGNGPLAGIAQQIWNVINAFQQGGLPRAIDEFLRGIFEGMATAIDAWASGSGPQDLSDKIVAFIENIGTGASIDSKALVAMGHVFTALVNAVGQVKWDEIANSIDDKLAQSMDAVDWSAVVNSIGAGIGTGLKNIFSNQTASNTGVSDRWLLRLMLPGVDALITFFSQSDFGQSIGRAILESLNQLRLNWNATGRAIFDGIMEGLNSWRMDWNAWWDEHLVQPIKRFLGISSPSTVFRDMAISMIDGLIGGWGQAFGAFYDLVVDAINQILKLPGFAQIADFLGISPIATTNTGGGYVPSTTSSGISTGGTSGGGGGGATASNVINYNFYGDVYVGNIGDLQYECPPNTIIQSTAPLLVNAP